MENEENKMNGQAPVENETIEVTPKKTSWGALIGLIIILVLIVLGALYFGKERIKENKNLNLPPADETEILNQSQSNEVSDIEKDLEAVGVEDLDSELENLDQVFE